MNSSEMFADLSGASKFSVVEGNSAQELVDNLNSIRVPFKVIQIYSAGGRHYACVQTLLPFKKKTKKG